MKKKLLLMTVICALVVTCCACGCNSEKKSDTKTTTVAAKKETEKNAKKKAKKKSNKNKVLVAYFSNTGNTAKVAKQVKSATGGKLFEIKPQKAYTKADTEYNNDSCRANKEQNDSKVRPKIKNKVKNIEKYDVIFVGHPIWYGQEPRIINTFLESYNLKGKKVVTFCTSEGSGITGSEKGIKKSAKGAKVTIGKDFTGVSMSKIREWALKYIK